MKPKTRMKSLGKESYELRQSTPNTNIELWHKFRNKETRICIFNIFDLRKAVAEFKTPLNPRVCSQRENDEQEKERKINCQHRVYSMQSTSQGEAVI